MLKYAIYNHKYIKVTRDFNEEFYEIFMHSTRENIYIVYTEAII